MENKDLAKWYVIHTFSGYEKMVESKLRIMIENNNVQDFIFDVVIPVEDEIVEKNGKKKVVERKRFPGYVFLKMVYTDQIWWMVTSTQGVTGFVGPAGRPLPLTPEEVKRNGLEKIDIADFDILEGDSIRVISGPLESFIGVVEGISGERQKVKVVVSMFGRQTPVELDFTQVEKIKA